MANTLTGLIPTVYRALDVVSRELVGAIPAVTRDPVVARAAVGQTVDSPVAPAATATDITPSNIVPDDGDQTIGKKTITINKSRRVPFRINGEETRGLNNGGPGYSSIQQMQIEQAFRTLTNEIETDLVTEMYLGASRAYGAATTTPFGSDLTESAQIRKILSDNGAPLSDMHLVMDTSAGANVRSKVQTLINADSAADTTLLRQGILGEVQGMKFRESGQLGSVTAGTASSATTNTAGYAIGDTVITLASAGTGTILAGDVITFAGDTNKYVVASGNGDVSAGGTITLAQPGLRVAIGGSATDITMIASSVRNLGFARSAVVLSQRLPALPDEEDLANGRRIAIIDPRSGIPFELAVYPGYRQITYELSAAWGVGVMKTEHLAVLLG